ncbi:MAG: transposase [Methanomicrobia archaeon]|nr:transposase [Methanomicrobia archaeon]
MHQGSPNDAKLYHEILKELKRRRIMRNGDTVIFDKEYYSYNNYLIGISKFKIVPLIFPRKDFIINRLSYHLNLFHGKKPNKKTKSFFRRPIKEFKVKIENWKESKPIKSYIEDVSKVAKNSFSLDKIHRYTFRSDKKFVNMDVFLIGFVILLDFNSKEELQKQNDVG